MKNINWVYVGLAVNTFIGIYSLVRNLKGVTIEIKQREFDYCAEEGPSLITLADIADYRTKKLKIDSKDSLFDNE